jgi:hypothetical protein
MRGGQWEDIVDAADRPERDSDHRPRGGERVARAECRRHGSQARVEESAQAQTRTGAPALVVVGRGVPAHVMPVIADLGDLKLAYLGFKKLESGTQVSYLKERANIKVGLNDPPCDVTVKRKCECRVRISARKQGDRQRCWRNLGPKR